VPEWDEWLVGASLDLLDGPGVAVGVAEAKERAAVVRREDLELGGASRRGCRDVTPTHQRFRHWNLIGGPPRKCAAVLGRRLSGSSGDRANAEVAERARQIAVGIGDDELAVAGVRKTGDPPTPARLRDANSYQRSSIGTTMSKPASTARACTATTSSTRSWRFTPLP
jgi:hypothetical protein